MSECVRVRVSALSVCESECVRGVCVVSECVSDAMDMSGRQEVGRAERCSTKNKNPTRQCEKKTKRRGDHGTPEGRQRRTSRLLQSRKSRACHAK